jgi:hypothetical protein
MVHHLRQNKIRGKKKIEKLIKLRKPEKNNPKKRTIKKTDYNF